MRKIFILVIMGLAAGASAGGNRQTSNQSATVAANQSTAAGAATQGTGTQGGNQTSNLSTTQGGTTAGATNQLGAFDRNFLRQASQDSLQEIQAGELAQTNSDNGDVQAFGAQLVTDHSAALDQIDGLATNANLTLPDNVNLRQQRQLQRLAGLTGTQFDRAFISLMIQTHMQDIQRFETAALRARSADVRAFARGQLPVLTDHLVTALTIRESLGVQNVGTGLANSLGAGNFRGRGTGASGGTVAGNNALIRGARNTVGVSTGNATTLPNGTVITIPNAGFNTTTTGTGANTTVTTGIGTTSTFGTGTTGTGANTTFGTGATGTANTGFSTGTTTTGTTTGTAAQF